MGLFQDLPLLEGWKYAGTGIGISNSDQPPIKFQPNTPLYIVRESTHQVGWVVQVDIVINDPYAQVTVDLDGQKATFSPYSLRLLGSVGSFPAVIDTSLSQMTIADLPMLGPAYGLRYDGYAAPLPFSKYVNVFITTQSANSYILAALVSAVVVTDKAKFSKSVRDLYSRRAGGPSIDIQEDVEETDTSLTINED